jgi:exopolyphosphatase/guanosine-5'-triphosphate,3'-diphosphate pyrophosphatase
MEGVATSAIRDASDGQAFVRQIAEETGLQVRVVDGDEESRLTYLGATVGVDLSHGALLCDLGGGSCELILAGVSDIQWARSLQIGSGRLSEQLVEADPPTQAERQAIEEHVVSTLRSALGDVEAHLAVFTGGTASHTLYLAGLDGDLVDIKAGTIAQVEDKVYAAPSAEIARTYDIRPERAAVLPAGITAMRSIARWSNAGQLCITRRGIREGIIIDALRRDESPRSSE